MVMIGKCRDCVSVAANMTASQRTRVEVVSTIQPLVWNIGPTVGGLCIDGVDATGKNAVGAGDEHAWRIRRRRV
jgi:hypothetical protein